MPEVRKDQIFPQATNKLDKRKRDSDDDGFDMDFFDDELPVRKKPEHKPEQKPNPPPLEQKKTFSNDNFSSKDSNKGNVRDSSSIQPLPLKKESLNEAAGRRPWEAQPIKTGVDQDEIFDEEILSDDFEDKNPQAKPVVIKKETTPVKPAEIKPASKPSFKSAIDKKEATPERKPFSDHSMDRDDETS